MSSLTEVKKKAPEGMPQELVDAVVECMVTHSTGVLSVHFVHGGIATVEATLKKVYKGPGQNKSQQQQVR